MVWATTPQSKIAPALTIYDAKDMLSRDAAAMFKEMRKLKVKKIYVGNVMEETIAISNEDKDDMEFAKGLRLDSPSLTMFVGMVKMKLKVLTV